MNKKYIWYQLKQWIPVFGVIFLLLATIFWITVSSMSIFDTTYYDGDGLPLYYNTCGDGLLAISIPAILIAAFLPVVVFSYRFSKNKADTYSQIPMRERELKAIRVTLALILLLVAYTVAYWFGIMIIGIREATEVLGANDIRVHYNYWGYFGSYWALLALIILQYFISCFLAQLGNRPFDSILYIILGECFLGLGLLCLYSTFEAFAPSDRDVIYGAFNWANYSLYTPIYTHYHFFNDVVRNKFSGNIGLDASEYASFAGFIVLGLGAGFLTYFLKDPSGEHYGKAGARNIYISILPHVTALVIAISITGAVIYSPVYLILYYVLWSVGYLLIIVYFNRGFKLRKLDWIIFGSVSAFVFIYYLAGLSFNSLLLINY